MQMIDVLKRLAELDSANPNVSQPVMTQEQSIATVSNIEADQINECGPMGMSSSPRTPASIHMTADTGMELTGMLHDIMKLAGVSKYDPEAQHREPLSALSHSAELDGDSSDGIGSEIHKSLGIIDKMNDAPSEEIGGALAGGALGAVVGGPLGALTGAAAGDSLTDPDADEVEKETWDNAPEPEIQAHKYGDDQVTPKADEPPKVNGGGNPYKQTSETVESVALQLLKDYQAFVNEGKVNELSKDTLKSYNDKATTDIAKRITGDDKDLKKIGDRQKGYERASKRGVK
jgi:hypothetical protein